MERSITPGESFDEQRVSTRLFRLSIGVFFIGGFLTSVVSLLVPRLQLQFDLGYARSLLVQLAFHASYLIFAAPILAIIVRAGYMRSIATGLAVMIAGCMGFVYTQLTPNFTAVLVALLLLSVGITFLQIASNAVVTVAGPPRYAASRLTLLQGYNSLGTVLGPLLCAQFLLPDATGAFGGGAGSVVVPFIVAGGVLAILSISFAINRDLLGTPRRTRGPAAVKYVPLLLDERQLRFGTLAMFAYVGAEVTIGSLLTNYLMLEGTIEVSPVAAGRMVALYWGGAMVGRFAGAFLLRLWHPATMLAVAAIVAAILTAISVFAGGVTGAVALLSVGLCNAIMYPTIYALALPQAQQAAPIASMFLCVAVVGGAIVPYLTGVLADHSGVGAALLLPGACYIGIALFGRVCARTPVVA